MELRAGAVDVDRVLLHRRELRRADEALGLGGDRRVHRDDVGLGEQVVERVGGVGRVRVVRDDAHAEPLEPPLRRPADRAEPDDADGAARELPGPEALVGDRAVAPDLALAHVRVGPDDAAVHREEQPDGDLGHGVGVAARGAQHRDARGRWRRGCRRWSGRRGTSRSRTSGRSSTGPFTESLSTIRQVGALGLDALGELLGSVEAQRPVVDPRVEHDVGAELAERLESLAAERRGHECLRAVGHRGSLART